MVYITVDNDPHFIVRVKGLADSVCFDVMGNEGDVYNLVKDEISGLYKICGHDSLQKNKKSFKGLVSRTVLPFIYLWANKKVIICA